MSKYKKNDIVTGKVTGIEDYGIFVKLKDGFTGLIHISEISSDFVKNVSDYVRLDDNVVTKVLDVDAKEKKLKLSIKALKNKTMIKESPNGFKPLETKLPIWINEKIKEYNIK